MGFAQLAWADCTDVIKLSRGVTSVVQDRESIQNSANAFCKEHKSGTSSSKTSSYGVSYGVLAASMGNSKASASEVASRYCSSSSESDARKDAYRQYVESINDKAYAAYEACERLNAAKINFTVTSQLKKDLLVVVGNASASAAPAKIRVTTLGGPDCKWQDKDGEVVEVLTGTSATLKCSRPTTDEESSITLLDLSTGAGNSLTVPWVALDKDGVPINFLKKLNDRVDEAVSNLNDASKAMKSAVVSFNLPSCPSGWSDYKPAAGRFIRGIDKADNKADPDGIRALESIQEDSFKQHTHTMTLVGRSGNNAFVNRPPGWGYDNAQGAATAATSDGAGGAETRPKNVALLYCVRD